MTWTPQSVSRDIDDPTVFVIPTVRAPRFLQYLDNIYEEPELGPNDHRKDAPQFIMIFYLRAIKVSAVSPD